MIQHSFLARRAFAGRLVAALAAILLAGCAAPKPAAVADCGFSPQRIAKAEALVRQAVARGHAPGIVVDLRCQGRPLLAASVGLADSARQRPMRQDDLFRIYSMTKPVTSLAAMLLIEDGRLSLDDPIAKHLPEFAATQVIAPGEAGATLRTVPPQRPATVRDLLRHTAGMTYISPAPDPVHKLYVQKGIDHGGGNLIVPTDGSAPVDSVAELSRRIAAVPMLHQPGERHSYGNATDVLGHLVAVVAGKPLRAFMAERLFQPLGMRDTGFEVAAAQLPRLTAAYGGASQIAGGANVLRRGQLAEIGPSKLGLLDDPEKSVFAKRRAIDFGGAGLVSTAADYQRFLQLLLQGGSIDGQRIVRAASLAEMTRNQLGASASAASALGTQGLGFGLGFATFDDPSRAPTAIPRGGVFWGGAASTYFWADPGRGVSGVLLAQVFGGDVMPYFLELLDALYGPAP
jgi:CubicO group peptidase (beta-lactamase class C family)